MKFGSVPIAEAVGGTAVHSIRQGDFVLKKGTLIGSAEVAALKTAGVKEITVARLDPGDVSEDQAAADIAAAIAGEGVRIDRAFTGRCNLFAESAGVLVVDRDAVDSWIFNANTGADHRIGQRRGLFGRHSAQQDRHQQRGRLIVGQAAVGYAGNKKVDGGAIERTPIPLVSYQVDRAHQGFEEEVAKAGLYYRLE